MNITHLSIPLDTSHTSLDRSPGIHLSSIINKMAIAQGIYSASPSPLPTDDHHFRRCLGLAWEDWLSIHLLDSYPTFEYHIGEFCVDDIYMHPDGIHYDDDGSIVLHEMKLTYYSTKQLLKPLDKLIVWFWQGMGYLYGLSHALGQHCTRAVFHPAFVCGNYSPSNPLYRPFQCDFKWQEITAHWEVILANKHLATPESYSPSVSLQSIQNGTEEE